MTEFVLGKWANKSDDRIAILYENESISFADLSKSVNRFGNLLKQLGVKPAERVLLRMSNHPLYIALNMAVIKIGAVAVPTSTLFREREIEYILGNSEAKIAIAMPEFLPEVLEIRNAVPKLKVLTVAGKYDSYDSVEDLAKDQSESLTAQNTSKDDLAFILYTSGTTSFPKGVPHSHKWLLALGEPNSDFVMGIHSGDRILTPSEMTWMWPWGYCIWFAMYRGASACIYSGRFDGDRTFEYLQKYKATHVAGNPTIYRRLVRVDDAEHRYDLSNLRAAFSSGETLAPELFKEWKRRFGCEIYDCLGQTELHVFCATRPGSVKLGSMGRPLPGIPVSVIDEDGEPCKPGEIGYLAVRKEFEGLTEGYLKLEEEWKKKIRGIWYLTWDHAYIDDDGYYWYISRADDLIKSRGYLIAPKEIEDVLQEHTSVLESSVIGVKDHDLRERVVAMIILREGLEPSLELASDIRKHVVQRIAPFKAPKEIIFVDAIPKTVTGKIMRKAMKEDYESGRNPSLARYKYTF
ncbi:MAG: acyl-CoA synthetase [Nitrososphaerota archaeon]|nr:acyl-CoA synthetase [Nitrososphaerota archaeon]